jgi:diadenosine tetraphosphatase ApaH/serine/threonine PP2A family protein phosphatase
LKLALLADLHANLFALDACLEHARTKGADRFAILGDLVGYGPHPVEVVERCRELVQAGALIVRGNHDELPERDVTPDDDWFDQMSAWTRAQLSETQLAWLRHLPLTALSDKVFLVHATADAPERWQYVLEERSANRSMQAVARHLDVRYVFGGHVHEQSLFYRITDRQMMRVPIKANTTVTTRSERYWLATVGSVGQPRDGDTRANYAMLDLEEEKLTFHRVEYDYDAVASEIRELGLPEILARRLESGR